MGTDANWMDQKLPPLPHGEPPASAAVTAEIERRRLAALAAQGEPAGPTE